MSAFSNNQGFSLVEILVAVMILAIITSTIWLSFSASLDTQFETRQMDERIHEVRSALDRIAMEISMAYLSTQQSRDKRTQTLFLGKNLGDSDRIDFNSFSHLRMLKNAKESDQCELSYYTESDGENFILYRREDPLIDDDSESGGNRFILLENVTAFNLRYYDPTRKSWVDDWDTERRAYRHRLPGQVEIKITYKNTRDEEETLQTRTLIYLMEALQL